MFLDLDGFKAINDSLGHAMGDRLLVQVAHRLATSIRPGDTAARFGGDEYVLVCHGLNSDTAIAVSARILHTLQAPFDLDDRHLTLQVSVGITLSEADSTVDSMVRQADTAMYQAKSLGGGRAVLWHQDCQS
jgi:diguanylate cyclase (GGDEF)-like protein